MWRTRSARSHRLLIQAYERYLTDVCGLAPTSREVFAWNVHAFLAARFGRRAARLEALQPADTVRYVMSLPRRWKPASCRNAVTALRSFFRWAQMQGRCAPGLASAVPIVSCPRSQGIPKHLSATQLAELLGSCDRAKRTGCRDYAIILCMARLGLRVGEVARMELSAIDWANGVLQIPKSKGRRGRILPLSQEVGSAIVCYLRTGRPPTASRHVFISHARTTGQPLGKSGMRRVTRNAFIRAGLQAPSKGTHVLRHTAATQMIQAGATIKDIADVLGHSSIDTTNIYTKVDLPTLVTVTMPWPTETAL